MVHQAIYVSRGVFYSRWGNTFSQIWDNDSLWMFESVMVIVYNRLMKNRRINIIGMKVFSNKQPGTMISKLKFPVLFRALNFVSLSVHALQLRSCGIRFHAIPQDPRTRLRQDCGNCSLRRLLLLSSRFDLIPFNMPQN